jgi:hypothetical protein
MTFTSTYLNETAQIPGPVWTPTRSSEWSGCWRRWRARRARVLPRDGQQGRQRLSRRQRLPLDRGVEAHSSTDNVSELTARTNDEGWETVFANRRRGS